MNEIKCCIAKDLIPLYIDDVLSEESAELLRDHLESCAECRREYRMMHKDIVLPTNQEVQEENSRVFKAFKSKWAGKKAVISAVSVLVTLVCIFFGFVLGRELLFDQSVGVLAPPIYRSYVRNAEEQDGWIRLTFEKDTRWYDMIQVSEKEEYLEFDTVFAEMQFVNIGGSAAEAELRVLDCDGNVVVQPFVLEPGRAVYLQQLERDTPYIVEFRGEGNFFGFSFS